MKLDRKKLAALFLAVCLTAGVMWFPEVGTVSAAFSAVRWPEQTLVIDPGHGGEDGGTVALSGTAESGINLDIALKLDQLCGLFGVHTLLLRETDVSLGDTEAATLRERKRSDLLTRTEIVNETENAVLLSIHQNHYSDQSSHGAQVFCRDDTESAAWGAYTQAQLATALDPENDRASKVISQDVYLMNHIQCRAILVECGFLSNPTENERLESDLYQQQLAAVLLTAYMTYLPDGEGSYEGKNTLLLHVLRQ